MRSSSSKRIAIACALALAGISASASAVDAQKCADIKSASKRLSCFDAKAKQPEVTAAQPSLKPETQAAVAAILKTLRKLDTSTSVGINMRDYAALVRDSSFDIDESLRSVSDGDFKTAVVGAEHAYIDANTLLGWTISLKFRGIWIEHSADLLEKYGIDQSPFDSGNPLDYTYNLNTAAFLVPIWFRAKELSELAGTLASDPERKTAKADQKPADAAQKVKAAPPAELHEMIGKPLVWRVKDDFEGGAYTDHDRNAPKDSEPMAGKPAPVYASFGEWMRITPPGAAPRWLQVSDLHAATDVH